MPHERLDLVERTLAKMAFLRGDVMDAMRLQAYSRALGEEFKDDRDTLAVLDRMVRSRRAEYEAKIPEMGDLLEMVRERRHSRLTAEREAKLSAEHDARWSDYQSHPENYVSVAEILNEYHKNTLLKAGPLETERIS